MHTEEEQHYAVYTRERVDNATANNPFCIILISLTDTTSRIMIFKNVVSDKVWTLEFVRLGRWTATDRVQGQTILHKIMQLRKWISNKWVTA